MWIAEENWPKVVSACKEFEADYPADGSLPEAQFYLGRAYGAMGLYRSAKRQWHQLSEEKGSGLFGRLAKLELEMLSWREFQLPEILEETEPSLSFLPRGHGP